MSTVESRLTVDVVFAEAEGHVLRRRVEVSEGTSVMRAIEASGIAEDLPESTINPQHVGIFGRRVAPDQVVRRGDRIEIYRPLRLDPMEARRRRAR